MRLGDPKVAVSVPLHPHLRVQRRPASSISEQRSALRHRPPPPPLLLAPLAAVGINCRKRIRAQSMHLRVSPVEIYASFLLFLTAAKSRAVLPCISCLPHLKRSKDAPTEPKARRTGSGEVRKKKESKGQRVKRGFAARRAIVTKAN